MEIFPGIPFRLPSIITLDISSNMQNKSPEICSGILSFSEFFRFSPMISTGIFAWILKNSHSMIASRQPFGSLLLTFSYVSSSNSFNVFSNSSGDCFGNFSKDFLKYSSMESFKNSENFRFLKKFIRKCL